MATENTVLDPVCGMLIVPERAAAQREHGGEVYFFCSAGCTRKFDADGTAYIAASRSEGFVGWHGEPPEEMGRFHPPEERA